MCKKCLSPWTLGQFTIQIQSSNHRRKRRRGYQIERLQKKIKSATNREQIKLNKRIKKLQEQNNHVAVIYDNLLVDKSHVPHTTSSFHFTDLQMLLQQIKFRSNKSTNAKTR
jgi:hypothetical protein